MSAKNAPCKECWCPLEEAPEAAAVAQSSHQSGLRKQRQWLQAMYLNEFSLTKYELQRPVPKGPSLLFGTPMLCETFSS